MCFSYHVNICHIHSQSFKNCHTTVVTVVTKCIFGFTLVVKLSHWEKYFAHVFSMIYVVSSCVLSVWSQSSLVTVHISCTDPTLSQIWKTSWPNNLASSNPPELLIAQFEPSSNIFVSWNYTMCFLCLPKLRILQPQASSLTLEFLNCAVT